MGLLSVVFRVMPLARVSFKTFHLKELDAAGYPPAASGRILRLWIAYCAGTLLSSGLIAYGSAWFVYDREVDQMPIIQLTVGLVAAGVIFFAFLPRLIVDSSGSTPSLNARLVLLVVLTGLAARLVMLTSEPILENDYYRYLWDGAVVAQGHNPYAYAPQDIMRQGPSGLLGDLIEAGNKTLSRIGHKHLTSIYPPVAQGLFGLAYAVEPWSLTAWRSLLIAGDTATFFLLLKILDVLGRSRLWVALYWLNPLVIKEGFNSAHMEPLLMPLVLGFVFLASQRRNLAATVALGLAAGIKLWPALLAPLLWRSLVTRPSILAVSVTTFTLMMGLWVLPLILSSPLESAGLKAYAEGWRTNSALMPALEALANWGLHAAGMSDFSPARAARIGVALLLAGVALGLARHRSENLDDMLRRVTIIVMSLVLLSPAQYPWYALWLAPLLVFWPSYPFLLLSATLPLYYLSFHLAARDAYTVFTDLVVWIIWIPIWLMLVYDGAVQWLRARIPRLPVRQAKAA